ncbi:MAG TPA: hypothetical protein VF791_20265 [Pyrinomonadaceae bacterium]
MKLFSLILLLVLLPGSTNGQSPQIGLIDFYGLRSLSEQRARAALQIKEGDAPPESLKEARARLEALPNVEAARLKSVCCEEGKRILYVGISEKGAPTLRFRRAPQGSARLPAEMLQAGKALEDAAARAVQKGDAGEDDSQGHALYNNTEARAIQQRFIAFAARDLKLLRTVLRESGAAPHRALAAEIIAYAANKGDVVKDLVYGMSDPDEDVRNNSMRALAIIAGFARNAPAQHIKVPIRPFVEMLNSIEWSDRNKSAFALYMLTGKRDAAILSTLRKRALQSLVEMSRWKSSGHAQLPFFILGRVGNLSEEEIWKAWMSGNRESVIERVLAKPRLK